MTLVDSDILSEHLRGAPEAQDWLLRARSMTRGLAVSAASIVEVAGGMRSGERSEVRRLLSSFEILHVSERIAWRAGELRRSYRRSHTGISLGDYLIASTAAVEGLDLATLNVRHFPMFPQLVPAFVLGR
ncbi:MAG: type II toxin-antitoxin system VapC family toxin [Candidatus Dormiibacterota bacterium]